MVFSVEAQFLPKISNYAYSTMQSTLWFKVIEAVFSGLSIIWKELLCFRGFDRHGQFPNRGYSDPVVQAPQDSTSSGQCRFEVRSALEADPRDAIDCPRASDELRNSPPHP